MIARKVFEEPEVYKIDVPYANIVTKETNIYVIRDKGEVLVVDMGAPTQEAAEVFSQALAELGIALDEPKYFFTHLHFDHSGLAPMLLDPSMEIYIGEKEIRAGANDFHRKMKDYVKGRFEEEGMTAHEAEEKSAMIEIATTMDSSEYNILPASEGDVITVGRFPFMVINLFGHTRGMVGLFQPDSGMCFSGDQLLFCITPACALFMDGVDSIDAYNNSMDKLLSLPITHLFHSHGDIRADFRERAKKIRESRANRLRKAVDFIAYNPGLSGVEVIRNMGWRIPFASIDECEQHQQWLIYTQGIAMLDHLVRTGLVERVREPSLSGVSAMSNTYRRPDGLVLEIDVD